MAIFAKLADKGLWSCRQVVRFCGLKMGIKIVAEFVGRGVFPLTFASAQYMLIMYPEEGGEGYPFSGVWTLL